MYEAFYGLSAEPFRLTPDHRFSFNHRSYARAKAYLEYGVQRAEGFVMITGRPGTGKTTLINDLLWGLRDAGVSIARLVSTQVEAGELLRLVAFSFGLEAEGVDKATVLRRLEDFLDHELRQGRRAVLIVDEAQDVSAGALEELRLLTNLESANQPLLQVFLVGQEELRGVVRSKPLEQLHQRMIAACHLQPLSERETRAYVEYRLKRVGWRNDPSLSEGVFPLIHSFSQGVPRRINQVCSRLLLHGFVEDKHALDEDDLRAVLADLREEMLSPWDEPEEGVVLPSRTQAEPEPELGPDDLDPPVIGRELKKKPFDEPAAVDLGEPVGEPPPEPEPVVEQPPAANEDAQPAADADVERPATAEPGEGRRVAREAVYLDPEEQRHRRGRAEEEQPRRGVAAMVALTVVALLVGGGVTAREIPGPWSPAVDQTEQWLRSEWGRLRQMVAGEKVADPAGAASEVPDSADPGGSEPEGTSPAAAEPPPEQASAERRTEPARVEAQRISLERSPESVPEPLEPVPAEAEQSSSAGAPLAAVRLRLRETFPGDALALRPHDDGGVYLDFIDPITFKYDSAQLQSDYQQLLSRLSKALVGQEQVRVRIVGLTDSRGSPAYNQYLSEQRAQAVADYLIQHGLQPDRLQAEGQGAAELNLAGPHASRRVDLYLTVR